MTGRLPCLVPGCKRTLLPMEPGDTEGICATHWRLTDPRRRRLYARVRRKAKRQGSTDALVRLTHNLWAVLRTQAIERAVGLG